MKRTLDLAIGSTWSLPGDLRGNLEEISKLAKMAGGCGCQMLLTPELSATGYGGYPQVLALAEPAGSGPVFEGLANIAARNRLVLLAGFAEQAERGTYLSHYIVFPDGRFLVQRKHRVTPSEFPLQPAVELYYDDTEEIGHVHPGQAQFEVFEVNGIRCVLVICADWGIRGLKDILDSLQIDLTLLPTGAGGTVQERTTDEGLRSPQGREDYRSFYNTSLRYGDTMIDCLMQRRALAAVNLCGYDGIKLYHGGSGSIVSPYGELAALIPGIQNMDRAILRFACARLDFPDKERRNDE